MPNWDRMATRANRRVASTFGKPGFYYHENTQLKYPITACLERNVQVFGESVEVTDTQTHISFPVSEVPSLKNEEEPGYDKIEAEGSVWKVMDPVEDDGFMIRFEVREDRLGLPDYPTRELDA